jgi:hypothetical protein
LDVIEENVKNYHCVHMDVNAKMIPVETILRMGGGGE